MKVPGRALSTRRKLAYSYRGHFQEHRRERLFLSTVGFFGAFGTARAITHAIKAGKGPFGNIGGGSGGPHIHHMTFGIGALLIIGYLWTLEIGTGRHPSPAASRATSLLYGAGAALTLDEFALWLNLEDDYWTEKGRESIDAVVFFGLLLALGALGGGVVHNYVNRLRGTWHSRETLWATERARGRVAQLRELLGA
jgi:hypothetical protein